MDKKKKQVQKQKFMKRIVKHNLLRLLLKNLYVDQFVIRMNVNVLDHDFEMIKKYLAMYEMTKKGKKNER